LKTFAELTPIRKRKKAETTSASESESEVQTFSPKRKKIKGKQNSKSHEKDLKCAKETLDCEIKLECLYFRF
jgi:hypothetical protein